ncbi:MAG: restriction endonuclease [Pseudomonadota bacterium]
MARRRKNDEGLADVLVTMPWWISVGLGMFGFIGMRWIFPAMLPTLLKSLAPAIQSTAWLPLILFGFLGLLSFVRSKTKAQGRVTIDRPSVPYNKSRVEPSAQTPHFDLNAKWDRGGTDADESATINKTLNQWTIEALRELEWKRFELLCAKYYEAVGFKSVTIHSGADGGIDIKLFKVDPNNPIAIVQCKAWNTLSVGVKEIRELLGVMAHEKVNRGIFIITGSFSKDALSFGATNPIQLLDGAGFLRKIQELPEDRQEALLRYAFDGDYKTPTCASCGIKLIKRDSKRGAFWGCSNYPRCKNKIYIKG